MTSRPRYVHRLALAGIVAALLFPEFPPEALAQATLAIEARDACATGQVNRGVALMEARFEQTDDPTHVFNQGVCYEKNQRIPDAIKTFERFMALPNVSSAARTQAQARVARLRTPSSVPQNMQASAYTPAPAPATPAPAPARAAPAPAPTPAPVPAPAQPIAVIGQAQRPAATIVMPRAQPPRIESSALDPVVPVGSPVPTYTRQAPSSSRAPEFADDPPNREPTEYWNGARIGAVVAGGIAAAGLGYAWYHTDDKPASRHDAQYSQVAGLVVGGAALVTAVVLLLIADDPPRSPRAKAVRPIAP